MEDRLTILTSALLAESVSDWQALWEAFGIAQNALPNIETASRNAMTVEALLGLHERRLIDFVWRPAEPPWSEVVVDTDRIDDEAVVDLIADPVWWKPFERYGKAIYFGASDDGERLYRAGRLDVE